MRRTRRKCGALVSAQKNEESGKEKRGEERGEMCSGAQQRKARKRSSGEKRNCYNSKIGATSSFERAKEDDIVDKEWRLLLQAVVPHYLLYALLSLLCCISCAHLSSSYELGTPTFFDNGGCYAYVHILNCWACCSLTDYMTLYIIVDVVHVQWILLSKTCFGLIILSSAESYSQCT